MKAHCTTVARYGRGAFTAIAIATGCQSQSTGECPGPEWEIELAAAALEDAPDQPHRIVILDPRDVRIECAAVVLADLEQASVHTCELDGGRVRIDYDQAVHALYLEVGPDDVLHPGTFTYDVARDDELVFSGEPIVARGSQPAC